MSAETLTHQPEEWDEDDYDDDEADAEADDDIDAEAEEMARRLEAQLWEDIHKANAAANILAAPLPAPPPAPSLTKKEEACLETIKKLLSILQKDPQASSVFSAVSFTDFSGENALDMFNKAAASSIIPRAAARHLSQALIGIAADHALFGKLRQSDAPAIHLDSGKRKRDVDDDLDINMRPPKRPFPLGYDLQSQMSEAIMVVSQVLSTPSTTGKPTDPSVILSIQLPLHQIFLFSVTSSVCSNLDRQRTQMVQEVGGLIQVLGVLSGVPIGQTPSSDPSTALPPPDIGTAVYPCLIKPCTKTFTRLYTLRSHQHVHVTERNFHCHACPASFHRNHDLKRHTKLHDKTAWKCSGCQKIFSRKDAIKRHKKATKSSTRGTRSEACIDAEVIEVEMPLEEKADDSRQERRQRIWDGIATGDINGTQPAMSDPSVLEEGEIPSVVISAIQTAVAGLHWLLQGHVANAMGPTAGQTASSADPSAGQSTLANVISRALSMAGTIEAAETPTITDKDAQQALPPVQLSEGETRVKTEAESQDMILSAPVPSLSMFGLSDDQTRMLEAAISSAASAAQAQAEAEAALEEDDDDEEEEEGTDG